jgi:hypothetical protein
MNNFRFVTHLDTSAVMATLMKTMPAKWKPVEARGELNNEMIGLGASLVLRGHDDITKENWLDDLPVKETAELQPWKSMQRLLAKARDIIMGEAAGQRNLSGEMARAMISRLDPGSSIFWHTDNGPYHDRTVRFHVPLVTNPGCLMYSGPQVQHMEVGSLWFFNNKVRHSAANWGIHYRLHLIFEMYIIESVIQ